MAVREIKAREDIQGMPWNDGKFKLKHGDNRYCEERLVRRSSASEGGSDEAIHSFFAWRNGLLRRKCSSQ
jgi:hypothetical protein